MSIKNQPHKDNDIIQYLGGGMSEVSGQDLMKQLQEDEAFKNEFIHYRKLWIKSYELSRYVPGKIIQDKNKLELRLHNVELNKKLNKIKIRMRRLTYAIFVMLIVGCSFFIYMTSDYENEKSIILTNNVIDVPYGAKSQVTLPDGSKVWVNAGSKIRYASGFGVTSREVFLEGEAYFDVVKMKDIPFYVNTDLIQIKVYGTAFNVKSYLDEEIAETTLDRGAISIVSLDRPGKEILVHPKQKIIIRRNVPQPGPIASIAQLSLTKVEKPQLSEKLYVEDVVNTEPITAWKDNRLIFEEEQLEQVVKRLERRYNVVFYYSDVKNKSIRFTAAIKEMPIDQVLEAISLTSPIKYKIEGRDITLTENKHFKSTPIRNSNTI